MFLNNKYSTWYYSIINRAKNENRKKTNLESINYQYFEEHHIIPKCMGGQETVLLTAKEHYICHLLLTKMLEGPNRYKMINAFVLMKYSHSENQKRYTSNNYEYIKKLIAERNSFFF